MDIFNQSGIDTGAEPVDTSEFVLPGGVITKDGDTYLLPTGETIRLKGVNTRETAKPGDQAEDFKTAQIGADTQHAIVRDAIARYGYDKTLFSGEKDVYNRFVGDIQFKNGDTLSNYLLTNRLADRLMATPTQNNSVEVSDLDRAQARRNHAPLAMIDAMRNALHAEQNQFPLTASPYAATASQYGASLDKNGKSEYAGPGFIKNEEDYKGEARSNIRQGLRQGYASGMQGAYNAFDMLGKATGSEFLETFGKQGSAQQADMLRNIPTLRNGEAFDSQGNWKLDSFSKFADYAIGTAASSAPQMLLSIAAGLTAAPTFGASLTLPAAVYAGQTWENQKVKNIPAALMSGVGQSVVEMLGVTGKFTNIFMGDARKEIIKQLVAKGNTPYAAEQLFISKSKIAMEQVAEATRMVEGGFLKRSGNGLVRGIGNEAPEEVIQEGIQYAGEQGSLKLPDTPEDMAKLKNRLLNAGVGGAVLGGGLGTVHGLSPHGKISGDTSDAEFRAKQLELNNGIMPDLGGIVAAAGKVSEENPTGVPTLGTLSSGEAFKRESAGIMGGIGNWWTDKGPKALYDKWSNVLAGDDGHKGQFTAALFSLLGSNRAVTGGSIEEQQEHIASKLQSAFGSPTEVQRDFGKDSRGVAAILADPKVQDTIIKLLETHNVHGTNSAIDALAYYNKTGEISNMLGDHATNSLAIAKYADRINTLLKNYNSINKTRLTPREFINLKPINKNAISSDRVGFSNLLVKHLGIPMADAQEAVAKMLGDPTMSFLTDPFDELTNPNVGMVRQNLDMILNDSRYAPQFDKYLSKDISENAYSLAAKGGSYFVNKNFIGSDGAHLAALIHAAIEAKELSPSRGAFLAHELKDWLDMRNGTYHQKIVGNHYVKGALQTINFLSTIVSLPLAAVSSTVEFAQIYRNLNLPQAAKATRFLLHGVAAEVAGAFKALGGSHSELADKYHSTLFNAGFNSLGNTAQRQDVVTGYYKKWTEGFFKITGLTSVTNVTRFAKLGIAADAMSNWLDTIRHGDSNNPTQAMIDAQEHLTRIGVDAHSLLQLDTKDPDTAAKFSEAFTAGAHNFVVEAVIHPSKMNRPKFYSDPYLQLFTQFQGYTSAFTANILPRLLGDLRRTGSADQVNAAATIAMMMALTYFALFIKDMIKYGESPPEWLKDDKKFQRYIGQAGILGTAQRIWDTASPVIPAQSNNGVNKSLAAAAWSNVVDQAPALSFIKKLDTALSAESGKKTEKAAKVLPIFGTSTVFAKYIQKELGDY